MYGNEKWFTAGRHMIRNAIVDQGQPITSYENTLRPIFVNAIEIKLSKYEKQQTLMKLLYF